MTKMKNKKYAIAAALLVAFNAMSCSDDNISAMPEVDMQATDNYFDAGESYKSDLYVKPYVGYVGDPMPMYDSQAKMFRVYYLHDMRDGNSTIYHPIHQLATADAAAYQNLNEAVPCGAADEDDPAIGTGSEIYADGKYQMFYTGHKARSPREVLLKAISADGVTWTKDRSFRFQAPAGYNQDEFRDPYVFFDGEAKLYRMVVAAIKDGKAVLAQFTSTDLATWKEAEPFFKNKWGRFYECPDVFRMGDYWYLVYSDKDVTRQVQYFYAKSLKDLMNMGDDPAFPWRDEGKLEGTSFYAGKTASDGQNRYIWGWCATRQGNLSEGVKDWAGALVAHKLVQNADGTLGFDCPDAVKGLFKTDAGVHQLGSEGNATGNAASGYTLAAGSSVRFARTNYRNLIEFDVQANPGQSVFGLAFADCSDRSYDYRVYIEDRWNNLKFDRVEQSADGTESRQNINAFSFIHPDDGKYHITAVTDQSVCVVYVNGQYAFTNRIYGLQRNPWSLFCSDGEVKITGLKISTF